MRTGDTPATSGATSAGTRRTSSSRRPSRSTCCSPRGARDPARRRVGDRRRDPRDRRAPSAAPTWRCRWSGSSAARPDARPPPAHRPVGDPAAARDGRPVPRRQRRAAARSRSSTPASRKPLELQVVVPVEDMSAPRRGPADSDEQPRRPGPRRRERDQHLAGDLPAAPRADPRAPQHDRLRQQPRGSPSGSRSGSTSSPARTLVRAHHGSIAREQRLEIEEALKAGRLPGAGGDQLARARHRHGRGRPRHPGRESPTCVARGLQRIGRAGHQVGEPSAGRDLPQVPRRPARDRRGRRAACTRARIEPTRHAAQPARRARPADRRDGVGRSAWPVDELLDDRPARRAVRRRWRASRSRPCSACWPAATRPTSSPSSSRGSSGTGWRTWSRRGATRGPWRSPAAARSRIAACSRLPRGRGGDAGRRVGELDEEMVYEARRDARRRDPARARAAGASRRSATNRVIVTPAPGEPGKMPFWKGDAVGRPVELGRDLGAFMREIEDDLAPGREGSREGGRAAARATTTSTTLAAENLLAYLEEEREATGALPTDRTIVVERFRDELGDWRICHPDAVRRPRPRAVGAGASRPGCASGSGSTVQPIWSDDGIAIRLPEGDGTRSRGSEALLFPDPEDDRGAGRRAGRRLGAVRQPLPRERRARAAAAAAPARARGRRCGRCASGRPSCWRSPVAYGSLPDHPRDVPRVPRRTCSTCRRSARCWPAVERREIRSSASRRRRRRRSPGALLFDYIAAYMYEGDAPLAERRAQALTLDRDLLRELLGQEELRELLDAGRRSAELELELQALAEDRAGEAADQVHDLLRRLGDLSTDEVGRGTVGGAGRGVAPRLAELAASRRAVARADRRRGALDRDRGRRAATATAWASRRRRACRRRSSRRSSGALDGLLARFARTHGPFLAARAGRALGAAGRRGRDALRPARRRRVAARAASSGRAASSASGAIPEVLRLLRRRSLARLRREVEPVDPVTLARFLPAWQGVAPRRPRRGAAALRSVAPPRWNASRGGRPARRRSRSRRRSWSATCCRPASPATSPGCSTSSARWARSPGSGAGASAATTAASSCYRPGREVLRPAGPPDGTGAPGRRDPRSDPRAPRRVAGPASTASCSRPRRRRSDREVLDALWDLVWAGEVTNDTFAPLRALRWKRPAKDAPASAVAPDARSARRRRPAAGRSSRIRRRRPARPGRSGSTPRRWPCSSATAS